MAVLLSEKEKYYIWGQKCSAHNSVKDIRHHFNYSMNASNGKQLTHRMPLWSMKPIDISPTIYRKIYYVIAFGLFKINLHYTAKVFIEDSFMACGRHILKCWGLGGGVAKPGKVITQHAFMPTGPWTPNMWTDVSVWPVRMHIEIPFN